MIALLYNPAWETEGNPVFKKKKIRLFLLPVLIELLCVGCINWGRSSSDILVGWKSHVLTYFLIAYIVDGR